MFQLGVGDRSLSCNSILFSKWIGATDQFLYEFEKPSGRQYRLFDVTTGNDRQAFDHSALAAVLSEECGEKIQPDQLPIRNTSISEDLKFLIFIFNGDRWRYCLNENSLVVDKHIPDEWIVSPDGLYAVYLDNYNIWLYDFGTKDSRALTHDGVQFADYGSAGSSWGNVVYSGLQACWSPDSKRVLTTKKNCLNVKELPVMHYVPEDGALRPKVEMRKLAFPGDEVVETYELVSLEIETGKVIVARHRAIVDVRNHWGIKNAGTAWWSKNCELAYFLDMSRGDKKLEVVEFNVRSGNTRVLFSETSTTQINLSVNSEDLPPFFSVPETDELVWWSERDGWAHLYLYDLVTGDLKNTISSGRWQVRNIVFFDAKRREVFVTAGGRVAGRDPYYRDLIRINIDTGEIAEIAGGNDDCIAITQGEQSYNWARSYGRDVFGSNAVCPSGEYAVVTRTRADELSNTCVINRDGHEIARIASATLHGIPEGWTLPEPVTLRAADNDTEIFGLVFRPSDFSPNVSWPIVSHVYRSPDLNWVPKGSFNSDKTNGWVFHEAAAIAELGFIVVLIDGRGTAYREKAFLDHSYGNVERASDLADHVAGIMQLGERHPYMDLDRVGIIGNGTAAQGMFEFPDFYKVGVSINHFDARVMTATGWGDKYNGIQGPKTGHQYIEEKAENLAGKLLLMAGLLDTWHCPSGTFRIIDALQKAGKVFDMLILPNAHNGPTNYMVLRAWNYLVENLQGETAPKDFSLSASSVEW